MKTTWHENMMLLIGNLLILGFFGYVVFFKGYSGWWMVFPLIFHFTRSKECNQHEEKRD